MIISSFLSFLMLIIFFLQLQQFYPELFILNTYWFDVYYSLGYPPPMTIPFPTIFFYVDYNAIIYCVFIRLGFVWYGSSASYLDPQHPIIRINKNNQFYSWFPTWFSRLLILIYNSFNLIPIAVFSPLRCVSYVYILEFSANWYPTSLLNSSSRCL